MLEVQPAAVVVPVCWGLTMATVAVAVAQLDFLVRQAVAAVQVEPLCCESTELYWQVQVVVPAEVAQASAAAVARHQGQPTTITLLFLQLARMVGISPATVVAVVLAAGDG